jgi:recombination protein RecT
MTRKEVENIRNEAPSYKFAYKKPDTIWGKYFEDMGAKTVLRRLMKYVPLSPEISRAASLDEWADNGIPQRLGSEVIMHAPHDEQNTVDAIAEMVELNQDQEAAGVDAQKDKAKGKAETATKNVLDKLAA